MPVFRYKATTADGQVLEGEMEGPDRAAVIARIQASGSIPINAEPAGALLSRLGRPLRARAGQRIRSAELVAFTRELASLMQAGLPLDRALQIMHEVATDARVRDLIRRVRDGVREGDSLSRTLESQGGAFSPFYVSIVRAAEAGGHLDTGLMRLADYLERARALRDKVLSALIYPALLASVAVVSLLVILTFVVPKVTVLFNDLGATLPLSTRVVIGTADLVREYWWLLILLTLGVAAYVGRIRRNPRARAVWDRRLLRLPLVGPLALKIETARLSRSLGTLLANGLPLLRALSIARDTLSNRHLALTIEEVGESVKEGAALAETLMDREDFPRLALQMIKVGEETGQLEPMLLQVADLYDQETGTAVQRLLSILEPVLIVGLGVLIGGIIMSILVAIVSVNDLPI